MGLEKIYIEDIENIVEDIVKSYSIFSTFELNNYIIQKLYQPAKFIDFNFTFFSKTYNREIVIRISDYDKPPSITLWIKNTSDPTSNKIDVELYFLRYLKLNNIKPQFIFKANSEDMLKLRLDSFLKYVTLQLDENLKKIIVGELWIDMGWEWDSYYK